MYLHKCDQILLQFLYKELLQMNKNTDIAMKEHYNPMWQSLDSGVRTRLKFKSYHLLRNPGQDP